MVKLINGDLLEAKETYIAHQVNCYGAMGRGVALFLQMMVRSFVICLGRRGLAMESNIPILPHLAKQ